jgi:lipopolysaccharide exporter
VTPVGVPGAVPSLAGAARRGVLWEAAAYVLPRLMLLASTVVLARVLGPADYGLVSLAVVVIMALNIVSDLGVSQALVYLPRSAPRTDAALATALLGSMGLAAVWVVAAPWTARWLGDPHAAPLLSGLALVLVLMAAGQVADAILRKELQFSRRLPGELARGVGRGGVAICLALAGLGAWSVVWAEVLGALAFLVVAWVMVSHRSGPWRGWLDRQQLRPLLGFGLPAAANGMLATLVVNVDYVVVTALLGPTALGLYLVGFRIPELLVMSVFEVFSQVTYPVYVKVAERRERLRHAYLVFLRVQAAYGLAVGAGIAVAAPVLVPVLFGDAYAQTVPVMQAIACYVVFRSVAVGAVDVFKAVGRPQLGVWLGVGRLVALVPALLVAARWGIVGVAVAQAMLALVFAVVIQVVGCKVVGARAPEVLRALGPAVLTGAASGLAAAVVVHVGGGPSWWSLCLAGVAALVAGAITLGLTDRQLIRTVLG